ncbi:uncharacterized protein [Anabrus simplex]|uniref:uncharacterized protein isoform X1 n=1 Tax=Anabrus simplex TaxID=316456 RepID=UPI0035A350BC
MSRVTVIVISTIYMACLVGLSYTDKPCNPKDLYKCGSNESCQATDMSGEIGVCKCKTDFQRKVPDGPCIANPSPDVGPHSDPSNQPVSTEMPPTSSLSVSTVVTGVLVPLLVLGAIGLVFAARRYHWLQKLHRLRVRRYDEVRIGQDDDDDDDPPLA